MFFQKRKITERVERRYAAALLRKDNEIDWLKKENAALRRMVRDIQKGKVVDSDMELALLYYITLEENK